MEIQGTLVEKFYLKKGTGQKGEWQIQEFLISVKSGNYENKVLLQAKECNYPIGAELKCKLNIKAREYNGKWYNSIEAWKIESDAKIEPVQEYVEPEQDESDNMPF